MGSVLLSLMEEFLSCFECISDSDLQSQHMLKAFLKGFVLVSAFAAWFLSLASPFAAWSLDSLM